MIYISIVVQLSRKIIKHVYNEPVYVADGGETMAYSELIKNFNKIRDYMRDFYVYGFKSRDDYTKKSARSYDDEKRRIESWLGEYMKFHQTADGKNVFLSIDSRVTRHNPLYKAWKTKSFTDGDITLRIMISVQSGRQYMMAYAPYFKRITAYRLDNIVAVKNGEIADRFDELRDKLNGMQQHMWGVATDSRSGNRMEHIEFTVWYDDGEQHIPRRLEREKRIGKVEYIDEHTCRFLADVYDASELIPWIRTFICRITDISISNKFLEIQFKKDLQTMYEMYGMEGEK